MKLLIADDHTLFRDALVQYIKRADASYEVTVTKDFHEAYEEKKLPVGLDIVTGEVMSPEQLGIWDNVKVKQSIFHMSTALASQLLLVDEIMKAGRGSRPKTGPDMNG